MRYFFNTTGSGNGNVSPDVSGTASSLPPLSWPAVLLLILATLACLLPFLNKAFHIDDPVFVWAAQHICRKPLDFYGFAVNWYGTAMPIAEVTKNPPGVSYAMAVWGSFFGWSEVALHTGFLLAGGGVVLGTYALGRELTPRPLMAALFVLLTPVFIVSATQVMSDVPMLALWVWAVYLWVSGERLRSMRRLLWASLLVAVCALTKYFGMALIPLLLVYSGMRHKCFRRHMLALLLPVALLAAYQLLTWRLYGRGLLLDAADYTTHEDEHRMDIGRCWRTAVRWRLSSSYRSFDAIPVRAADVVDWCVWPAGVVRIAFVGYWGQRHTMAL